MRSTSLSSLNLEGRKRQWKRSRSSTAVVPGASPSSTSSPSPPPLPLPASPAQSFTFTHRYSSNMLTFALPLLLAGSPLADALPPARTVSSRPPNPSVLLLHLQQPPPSALVPHLNSLQLLQHEQHLHLLPPFIHQFKLRRWRKQELPEKLRRGRSRLARSHP